MSVERKAVSGALWIVATSVGARALGVLGTLLLTRFLTPEVFGEVSVATVLVLLINQLSTLGVGQSIVAKPDAGRDVAFHATVCNVALATVALLATVLAAPTLGPLFDAPGMARYLPGLALSMMLDRLALTPERVLVRDMRYRVIGISRSAGELTYTFGSIALAVAGWGGMAIVIGNIARSVVRSLLLLSVTHWRDWALPTRLSLAKVREIVGFGAPLALGGLAGFSSRRVDNLLVSSLFGPGTLGVYNLAYNLADIPAVHIGEQIGDVLFPSFAHLKPEARRAALLRAVGLLSLIMAPLAIGLGAISTTLVEVLFDPRWAGVGPMLALLSAMSAARPIGWTISSYLSACHRTRTVMVLEVGKLIVLVALILTLGRLGPLWTCVAVGVAFALHSVVSLAVVDRGDVPLSAFLRAVTLPILACAPMVAGVLGIRVLLDRLGASSALTLAFEVIMGALLYVPAAWLLASDSARDLLRMARRFVADRRARPGGAVA